MDPVTEQKRIEWKSRKLFDIQQLATDLLPYELTLGSRYVDEVSGSESISETDVVRLQSTCKCFGDFVDFGFV